MTLTIEQIKRTGKEIALYKPLGAEQCRFHSSTAYFKWLFGWNQSSKTYTNMMDLAMLLQDIHPVHYCPEGVHWACIESWEQVRDVLWEDYLKKFLPPHSIANVDYGQNKVPRRVFFKNGHRLEFRLSIREGNCFRPEQLIRFIVTSNATTISWVSLKRCRQGS